MATSTDSKPKPILTLTEVLHLGMIDEGALEEFNSTKEAYFQKYHSLFWETKKYKTKRLKFRGEGEDEWIKPKSTPGTNIKNLQTFLQDHGFMPGARLDGVFGYWTLASLRLFQEYIRTVEEVGGIEEVGMPDGRVWKTTHKHMMRWQAAKHYCTWGLNKVLSDNSKKPKKAKSSKEYDLWLKLLTQIKTHNENLLKGGKEKVKKGELLKLLQLQDIENFSKTNDTRKISEWSTERSEIHLIGIRRQQDKSARVRGNDDLFILLMNGMVFKFWGSTDPHPAQSRKREPYLAEGQHKYRLAWHKVGDSKEERISKRIYKALRPYSKGVLVHRDWSLNDFLSKDDIRHGFENQKPNIPKLSNPNTTINIHWTFDGKTNWSAGCQVITGRSYINNEGKLIDCSTYSAAAYSSLSAISQSGVRRSRGAYTFVSDFILAYSKADTDHVLYTLCNDEVIDKFGDPKLQGLLALQSQRILDQFEKEEEKGMIAGFIKQMKESKNIIKKPKA